MSNGPSRTRASRRSAPARQVPSWCPSPSARGPRSPRGSRSHDRPRDLERRDMDSSAALHFCPIWPHGPHGFAGLLGVPIDQTKKSNDPWIPHRNVRTTRHESLCHASYISANGSSTLLFVASPSGCVGWHGVDAGAARAPRGDRVGIRHDAAHSPACHEASPQRPEGSRAGTRHAGPILFAPPYSGGSATRNLPQETQP